MERLTIAALQAMKREGRKIVGGVAWDTPMAELAERAGVDLISVGDSVGKNLWGHATENEVTVDELLVVCKAVRRGAERALVSCDVPAAAADALAAAKRLVAEGGAQMVKVLAPPDTVGALTRAGITVFAEFHGGGPTAELGAPAARSRDSVAEALLGGIRTHYEIIGDGPPLLMYAPGGFDATTDKWRTQGVYARIKLLDHLPRRYRCIAFDRRECGKSGGRVEPMPRAH